MKCFACRLIVTSVQLFSKVVVNVYLSKQDGHPTLTTSRMNLMDID